MDTEEAEVNGKGDFIEEDHPDEDDEAHRHYETSAKEKGVLSHWDNL